MHKTISPRFISASMMWVI